MANDVRLTIPAQPAYLHTVRMMARGLASRLSFTIDEMDDLVFSLEELLFPFIGAQGRAGQVHLEFELEEDGLSIVGHCPGGPSEVRLSEFAEMILKAMADDHWVGTDADSPGFRLVKHRRSG